MAIFGEGMACRICGMPLMNGQSVTAFSPFVQNEADPLSFFSDAVFHEECFHRHELSFDAQSRYKIVLDRYKPANRVCAVCNQLISDPDNVFSLGHLTSDETHAIHRYNYAHFHRPCIGQWPQLAQVAEFAAAQMESGAWRGSGMQITADALRTAMIDRETSQ